MIKNYLIEWHPKLPKMRNVGVACHLNLTFKICELGNYKYYSPALFKYTTFFWKKDSCSVPLSMTLLSFHSFNKGFRVWF
jgi:hypothetical protein